MALLLGILPLVADQRGFLFFCGDWQGGGFGPAPGMAPDVGPGAKSSVVRTPTGGRGCFDTSGRSAPLPRLPAGVPIPPEKWGERPGASPWTPICMAARSHSLGLGIVVSDPFEGLFPPVC